MNKINTKFIMADVDICKKTWSVPEIFSLSFKNTEGGPIDYDTEDETYLDTDPSGGV